MIGRSLASLLLTLLLCAIIVACAPSDGDQSQQGVDSSQQSSTVLNQPLAGTETPVTDPATPEAFTNDNWDVVIQDADLHKGASVTITGEVFNVLEDSDGYKRFQIYTDPASKRGNTHIAVKGGPEVKKGYEVRVEGILRGVRVATAVSGRELRIPEVEADSVEVTGPPSVITPTATPSPTMVPTVTPTPTFTPTPKPSPTPAPPTATPTFDPRSEMELEVIATPAFPAGIDMTPTGTPESEPTEEATAEPMEEPTPEPADEPTPEAADELSSEQTEEPMPEGADEPSSEPVEEPTLEPVDEPSSEPVEEPTLEPVDEPSSEPAANPE